MIVMAYSAVPAAEARDFAPRVVHVDAGNRITSLERAVVPTPEAVLV